MVLPDRYGTYPTGNPVIDPPGAASGSHRVIHGGSWGGTRGDLAFRQRGSNLP